MHDPRQQEPAVQPGLALPEAPARVLAEGGGARVLGDQHGVRRPGGDVLHPADAPGLAEPAEAVPGRVVRDAPASAAAGQVVRAVSQSRKRRGDRAVERVA